jgi:hypothetical protein
MKTRPVVFALIAGLFLSLTPPASAADLCILMGGSTTLVGRNLVVPAKGNCKPWSGFVVGQAGNILTGVICTSTDGTKVFANQYTSTAGELLKSAIALPARTGTVSDCFPTSGCGAPTTAAIVKCTSANTISAAENGNGPVQSTLEP